MSGGNGQWHDCHQESRIRASELRAEVEEAKLLAEVRSLREEVREQHKSVVGYLGEVLARLAGTK